MVPHLRLAATGVVVSALAEALLAAQRSALTTLERQYVAGNIEVPQFSEWLDAMGCGDIIEQAQLLAALNALKQYGTALPTTNGTKPATENEPASDAQWTLLRRLADERGEVAPDGPLTKTQASEAISALKAGTYNSDAYTVPF